MAVGCTFFYYAAKMGGAVPRLLQRWINRLAEILIFPTFSTCLALFPAHWINTP